LNLLARTINDIKSLDSDFRSRLAEAVRAAEVSTQSQVAAAQTAIEERFNNKLAELSAEWEKERIRLAAIEAQSVEAVTMWEAERVKLTAEIEKLREEAQKAAAPALNVNLLPEVERVEGVIKEISLVIEESANDLSIVIRKNVERSELESYLKGIHYAIKAINSK
jgi:hypothetical protein